MVFRCSCDPCMTMLTTLTFHSTGLSAICFASAAPEGRTVLSQYSNHHLYLVAEYFDITVRSFGSLRSSIYKKCVLDAVILSLVVSANHFKNAIAQVFGCLLSAVSEEMHLTYSYTVLGVSVDYFDIAAAQFHSRLIQSFWKE